MSRRVLGSLLVVLTSGLTASAQQTASQLERFERQLERTQRESRVLVDPAIPPGDRALVDYGGYLSLSYFHIDDPIGDSHVLGQYELVGYGRVNFDGAHEFFVRGNALYTDFATGDSFDGRGDDWVQEIQRAHYRFDLQRALAAYEGRVIDYNVVVQAGRQFVHWGNGVSLDTVIDGGVVSLSSGPVNLDLLGGATYDHIVDFDVSRPGFRDDTDRGLFGAMLWAQAGAHKPFVYGLIQRDYNGNEERVTEGVTTRFDYDSYYIGVGSSGALADSLLYGVEAVYEGGETLSNSFDEDTFTQVAQTEDDIQAWALDAQLDYLLADVRRSRLSGELILASGDSDRLSSNSTLGGNRPGTDDHGFNSLGLLNTGLAFAPAASNLIVLRGGASTFPVTDSARFRQLQVGVDVLVFNKFLEHGPIDEATNDHRFLGVEADFYLTWQITSDVTLALRYGGFIPGPAIEGDSGLRNLFFAGVTYAF
jgi:hypothetical protein